MGSGMLWLGIVMGCLAGLLMAGWFSRGQPPLETFFLHLLRLENRSMRTDTRVMLHELHRKVEELTVKIQRMDGELQDLTAEFRRNTAAVQKEPVTCNLVKRNTYNLSLEVSNLVNNGLSCDEIARRLNLGRGEVELILSLEKKPFWVVGSE